ncbi:hypothetical protein Pan2_20 [Pseudanabaena phage Pan2]|nr:hypothetical protein Pan2_20 [Pseudanabaena phage Pan2]
MAEGLTFTVGGNGILGDVEPGWSEQEFATPVNPNERAGGTGTVSFAAKDVAAGVLAINKAVTSEDAALGQVSGVVRTASKTGQRVAITHDNKLAKYNAVRTMPPMIAASVPGCLELAEQVFGEKLFTQSYGSYWSLFGHGAGFGVDGNLAEASSRDFSFQTVRSGETFNYTETATFNRVEPSAFSLLSGKLWAGAVFGSHLSAQDSVATASTTTRMACKALLNGGNWSMYFSGRPWDTNSGYGFYVTVTINHSANTISYAGEAFVGGILTAISGSTSIATLNRNAELALFMDYQVGGATPARLNIRVCNTSNYSTFVTLNVNTNTFTPIAGPWQITGNTRAIWMSSDVEATTTFQTPAEYEVTPTGYQVSGSISLGAPSIGYTGAVWDWLQDACSAYFWEVGLDGDVVTARPVGGRTLDTSNFGASPTLAPTTTRTGRSVDVVWHNASPTISTVAFNPDDYQVDLLNVAEVYDARSDDNRIISVGAAQETVTRIQTGAYLTSIVQPTRTTSFIPGEGTYYVIDSTGLPIVANQWEDYGGALSVAIDSAEAGTIEVTLTGPREQIPSTTAPYSLAVSDGQNQYAALSILGSGVVADPQTLNLLTGADPDITPQEVAFTVTNAFINTLEQAYDAGIWAAVDASGPRVAYTIDVPTLNLTGFGDTAGALIQAEDSTYRVTDATVGRTSASINAVRHATVGAFDDAWSGENVGSHDTYWDTFLCEDQRILPYAGTPEATLPPAPIFPP